MSAPTWTPTGRTQLHQPYLFAASRDRRQYLRAQLDLECSNLDDRLAVIEGQLLDAADVVGATCTGAGGPDLRHMTFDLVIMDEGSQCSE